MESETRLWGEFDEPKRAEDLNIPLSNLEDLIFPTIQPPQLYQPSREETASFQILPNEMCQSDPVVLHTIRLLQHQRQLIQIITRAQTFGFDVNATPPPFPEENTVKRKAAKLHFLNFLPPTETPFVAGVSRPQKLEIESMTARLMLRKAVATLCAHAGFSDSTENVLTVFTDVVHDFLTKLTHLLRSNKDNMMRTKNCPFHDVFEQTLHDMKLGSLIDLHKMYRDRVIIYHARVKQKTLQLHYQYQALLSHVGSKALSQSLRCEPSSNVNNSNNSVIVTTSNESNNSGTVAAKSSSTFLSTVSTSSTAVPKVILNQDTIVIHSSAGMERNSK